MSVQVKNYAWHRDWHDKMMADPGYQGCNAEARGIYQTCRNLAGITNNSGSLKIGTAEPMDLNALARHLAGTIPEMEVARARSLLKKLVAAGLLKVGSTGRVLIVEWAGDQQCSWSPEAERQRRSRERRKVGEGGRGTGGGGRVFPVPEAPAGGAARPPPPLSTSLSTGFDSGVTRHAEARDMSHREDEDERSKEEPYGSRTSTVGPSAATTGGGGGLAAGRLQAAQDAFGGEPNFDLVPLDELVAVACDVVGRWTPFDKNTFAKRLFGDKESGSGGMVERYGADGAAMRFRSALREVRDAMRTGKAKHPPSLLTMILGDYASGRGHNP